MKTKQTLLAIALMIGFGTLFISPVVSAASCGDAQTSILGCDTCPDGGSAGSDGFCSDGKTKPDAIMGILRLVIKILTAGVGIAAVGGIAYGSILYTTAGGSLDNTKKAKQIIYNVVIGLVAYALMYSFLNFLMPGGIF